MTDSSLPPDDVVSDDESPGLISQTVGTLLLLLPATTAIHAWLIDAPGKIWLSIFAVLAVAVIVIGWLFFRAGLLLFGLLGAGALITTIVYLYGVDSAPLAIAWVPLRLFVPGLFLVALALSAWELARPSKLPHWTRFIAPALAVFAAVPVVMGLIEGVPFVEVLVGLWTLPYWTQGAWFGAAIMLPAALLVAVLRFAVPAWRAVPIRAAAALAAIAALLTASLATSFTMSSRGLVNLTAFLPEPMFSLAIAREAGPDKEAGAMHTETSVAATAETSAPQQKPAAVDPAVARHDATVAAVGRAEESGTATKGADALWSRLQAEVEEIPRDRFDPAAVVAEVGTDPEALFNWVRDETVLLSYCGALKGPEGVLLDRGGNSLDRALLLRALLSTAGHSSRLAHAKLTPEQVAVLANSLGRRAPAVSAEQSDPAKLAERAATEIGIDAATTRQLLAAGARADANLQAALAARTERQSAALIKMLGSIAKTDDDASRFLSDHWWVLLDRQGSEPLNLDPSLADAQVGDHLAKSTHALRPGSTTQLASVGAACSNRLHSVRVRAVVEVSDGRKLSEHVLLDHELLPMDLFGHALTLGVGAYGGPEAPDPFSQAAPADALIVALLQHKEWQPQLTIGTKTVTGKVVTDTGKIRNKPGGGEPARSPLGGFGGSLAGGEGGDSGGNFTAFWWTFEISTPGVGTSLERRQVFDLIGAAARAAGSIGETQLSEEARTSRVLTLAGQTELIALTAAPAIDLLDLATATRLLAERDAWQALRDQGKTLPMVAIVERLNALSASRTPLERFALLRGRFAAAADRGPQSGLLVIAHHRRLRSDLSTDQGFDLIASAPGSNPGNGFGNRLSMGVADSNLEALLAARKGFAAEVGAVADAFDRDPGSWHIARQPADLEDSALSADLAARVANDLAAGFLAVVPTDPRDAVGWWRIDPNTGATLGFGSRGWGQAMSSYVERVQILLQIRGIINMYASMGKCLGLAVNQPLMGIETGVSEELAECIFTTICGAINDALANIVEGPPDWTTVIVMATIAEVWGGTPEAGLGGLCGGLWSQLR